MSILEGVPQFQPWAIQLRVSILWRAIALDVFCIELARFVMVDLGDTDAMLEHEGRSAGPKGIRRDLQLAPLY